MRAVTAIYGELAGYRSKRGTGRLPQ